jgi:hypothetical protein
MDLGPELVGERGVGVVDAIFKEELRLGEVEVLEWRGVSGTTSRHMEHD